MPAVCGDGFCDGVRFEDCFVCPLDCGACSTPTAGMAGLPFTGFVVAGQYLDKAPQEVCQGIWNTDSARLQAYCESRKKTGGFVDNPWNAPSASLCSKTDFVAACRKAYSELLDRAFSRRAAMAAMSCEAEANINAELLRNKCSEGVSSCKQYFAQGCAEATRQKDSCNAVYTSGDYLALARAFCLDTQNLPKALQIRDVESQRPTDSLPANVVVRGSSVSGEDDLKKIELSVVAQKVGASYIVGDFRIYDVMVQAQRAGQLKALSSVVDSGVDYASVAFKTQPELASGKAGLASDAITSFFVDLGRGGSYGIASYLAFKNQFIKNAGELKEVDDAELKKDFAYKFMLLLVGNDQENQEAQKIRKVAGQIGALGTQMDLVAPGAGDLVSTARFNSLSDKTGVMKTELDSEACRKAKVASGFVPWFADWVGTMGGILGENCPKS